MLFFLIKNNIIQYRMCHQIIWTSRELHLHACPESCQESRSVCLGLVWPLSADRLLFSQHCSQRWDPEEVCIIPTIRTAFTTHCPPWKTPFVSRLDTIWTTLQARHSLHLFVRLEIRFGRHLGTFPLTDLEYTNTRLSNSYYLQAFMRDQMQGR